MLDFLYKQFIVSESSTSVNSRVHSNSEGTATRKKGRSAKVMTFFEKYALHRMIVNHHITEKCHVTVKRLLTKAKSELNYEGGRESLGKTITEMDFRWRKTKNNRTVKMQREDIRLLHRLKSPRSDKQAALLTKNPNDF